MTDQPPTPTPDPQLEQLREQVYLDPRPQAELQKYYDWPLTREPDWMYTLVRTLTSLYTWIVFRTTTIDAKNIPTSGPLICAPNHFSNIDHFFLGQATRRKVQFMAKSQLYKGWFAFVMKHGGVFPIQRGKRDELAMDVARSILARDGTICVYAEGGRSRTGQLSESVKPGIGRIALETGATVLPIAIHGSARVRNWKRLQLPKVTVQYGEPLRFEQVDGPTREQQQAAADEIFARIKALYGELEARVGA
ncbi:MAG: 1-acyl-sn-glycerol-3-phosphate acyltransferase [Solirubrobacteraceae bacterium]|jgi:1-acyl-sn-glycerol-3-phosphate acyltransferase|nr:1-acyl-sn-glycerol-3-phosphate acyltransferase [Solirubrobacteraceae bacterium]MCU0313586.1 1-acyl-sn-glycerol-3-phosphate acyltransferase [Solirubrobacteraceae bacterium]